MSGKTTWICDLVLEVYMTGVTGVRSKIASGSTSTITALAFACTRTYVYTCTQERALYILIERI